MVTLYARVWIETKLVLSCFAVFTVTLYARVWIETDKQKVEANRVERHPLREGVD